MLLTWLNVPLMLEASAETAATMPITIRPTSTAYSTAVGPSSLVRNRRTLVQNHLALQGSLLERVERSPNENRSNEETSETSPMGERTEKLAVTTRRACC